MFALLVFALLAAASAVPPRHHSPFFDDSPYMFGESHHPSFGDEIFDTRRFWADLESELRHDIDDMISSFRVRFPTSVSSVHVIGNQYKLTIPLRGFEEKDINVKAKDGVVMVQAVHNEGNSIMNSYTDVRTLPADVDANSGVWSFDKDVLTVSFTLKKVIAESTEQTTTESTTTFEVASREEMGKADDNTQDADVGANDASSKEKSIITNEISDVDATTYAVDLKNEVEFVPVHYK